MFRLELTYPSVFIYRRQRLKHTIESKLLSQLIMSWLFLWAHVHPIQRTTVLWIVLRCVAWWGNNSWDIRHSSVGGASGCSLTHDLLKVRRSDPVIILSHSSWGACMCPLSLSERLKLWPCLHPCVFSWFSLCCSLLMVSNGVFKFWSHVWETHVSFDRLPISLPHLCAVCTCNRITVSVWGCTWLTFTLSS